MKSRKMHNKKIRQKNKEKCVFLLVVQQIPI